MFDFILKLFSQISTALGVEWAPLHVPMQRRLQTLAAVVWMSIALAGEGVCIYLYIQLLYSKYWYLGLLYGYWMLNDVFTPNRGGRKYHSIVYLVLQTLAAVVWMSIALAGEAACIYLYIQLLYSKYWYLGLLYAYWMLNDVFTPNRGGRKLEWIRNWSLWRFYSAYFPMRLVKTAELEPSKNYLFACYPHGLLSQGALCSFATNSLDFKGKFPGIKTNFATLGGHFLVPFFRDFIMALGMRTCDEGSLLYFLDAKKYEGNALVLMIGGAAEALDSHPGQYKVILSRRKGFIRVAMKSGASLVPVFSFGETDIFKPFENPADSLLRRFQEKVKKLTGVSPMFPMGRGIFQYSFGVLPFRSPITTVVGAPMEVKKNLEPTQEEIDAVHAQFSERLKELFETEKKNYLKNYEDIRLDII